MNMDTFLKCDYKTKQTFVNCADISITGGSGGSTTTTKSTKKPVTQSTTKFGSTSTTKPQTQVPTKTTSASSILPLWSQCGG